MQPRKSPRIPAHTKGRKPRAVTAPATTPQPTKVTKICFQDSPRDWAEPWKEAQTLNRSGLRENRVPFVSDTLSASEAVEGVLREV